MGRRCARTYSMRELQARLAILSTELTNGCALMQFTMMKNTIHTPPQEQDPVEAFYHAVRLTRPLLRHISASVDIGARAHGVTVGQRAVLEALYDGGAMTGPRLVEVLALKRQFVFRMLAETDREGFTGRAPNPKRARAYLHSLTDKGRGALAAIRADELATLKLFAASMAPQDISAWSRVQERLTAFFAERARSQISDVNDDGD